MSITVNRPLLYPSIIVIIIIIIIIVIVSNFRELIIHLLINVREQINF